MTISLVMDHSDAPRLLPFISAQKQYLSMKVIAHIAQQLLQALHYAQNLYISHRSLDESCIFVSWFDQKR